MLYQLPNGRVVYLTVEDFLNLDNDDINYLIETNQGRTIKNPFFNSSINDKQSKELYSYEEDNNSNEIVELTNYYLINDDDDENNEFNNQIDFDNFQE
jgi:hypothetical protein